MADAIKQEFISRSLENYGDKVRNAMMKSIDKKKAINTSSLRNSIYHKIYNTGNGAASIKISFLEYGRFIDMGVGGKGGNLSALKAKVIKRKPKKIYSPIAYGLLTPLINELQYGYSKQVIETIKNDLNKTEL